MLNNIQNHFSQEMKYVNFFVLIWEYMLTVTLIKSIQLQLHWYLWGSDSHMYIYPPYSSAF